MLAGCARAQISVPNSFVNGTAADANQVNQNFSALGTASLNRTGGTMTGNLTVSHATAPKIIFTKTNATAQTWAIAPVDNFIISDTTGAKTPFTIVKAAPTNSLYVTADGNLGLGVTAPVWDAAYVANGERYLTIQGIGTGAQATANLELVTQATDAASNVAGNLYWTATAQTGATYKALGYIYMATSGTTANNRGSVLAIATKADGANTYYAAQMDNTGRWTFPQGLTFTSLAAPGGHTYFLCIASTGIVSSQSAACPG